jgi:hypothetical protein
MTATHNYDVCENALQTILQGVSGLSSLVLKSDYSPYDNGAAQFIVLQPDTFDSGDSDIQDRMVYTWDILVEVYQKYTSETETMMNFRALRKAILNELEKYPTLNNALGVLSRTYAGAGGLVDVSDRNNVEIVYYKMQTIRVTVIQEVTSIVSGEFA